jgi:hypothetical protein
VGKDHLEILCVGQMEDNIRMDLKEIGHWGVDRIHMVQDRNK